MQSKSPQKIGPFRYSTPEHKKCGDEVELKFMNIDGETQVLSGGEKQTVFAYLNEKVKNKSNLSLSYGDILSLAGDYFSAIKPIATANTDQEKKERFLEAFNNLAGCSQETIDKIDQINKTIYSKNNTLNEYLQQLMFVITLGKKYYDTTNHNLDHFYKWSITAYKTGHEIALEIAKKGYQLRYQGDYEEGNKYLNIAYQINAFACHFLSDTFSSGHLREKLLRKDLTDHFGFLGGILVNNMHNEDSVLGVNVTNAKGDAWTAYGDNNYARAENKKNRQIQHYVLQQSADEIFEAYQTGMTLTKSNIMDYIPQVATKPNESYTHPQYAPLFKLINKNIYYRNPVEELNPDKVTYEKLNFLGAIILGIKLRFFGNKYIPAFTPIKTPSPAFNTTKIMNSTDCGNEFSRDLENTALSDTTASSTIFTTPKLTAKKSEEILQEESQEKSLIIN